MQPAADIAAEMDEGLRRLFQAGLELALQVQADAMAAQEADERARLAVAFHRISRGVRQTAALRMKLACDVTRVARDVSAEVVSLDVARTSRRRASVRAEVQRLIWTEYGDDSDREDLTGDLDELLDIETQDEAFLDQPVEVLVARIAQVLGLAAAPPVEGGEAAGDDGGFCSSA